MKLLLVLPLLALLAACTSAPATTATETPAETRRAIIQLLATQTAAWNRGDVANFMKGYWESDSLVFIGKSGLTYGWQPTLDNYRRSYPNPAAMGQLRFANLRVTPDGPDAGARSRAVAPHPPRPRRLTGPIPIGAAPPPWQVGYRSRPLQLGR